MDSFLKKECDLRFFHENGFIRKQCPSCKDYFWTLDDNVKFCGDKSCVDFSFIDNPFGKKHFTLSEVRNSFLDFFEKNGHSRLHYPETGERCPVVARWRSDIYLTIASIADFQPHVTSGVVPPPANPLVISQPCIRLNDLEEIGVSGRHLSMFEMMGHHAFNKNKDEIYWKNQTVAYCDEYFRKHIGIPREKINYKEQLWDGGGNAGPCLEVLAGGLEIATLVFMNMKEDVNGDFIINGKKYSPNPLNIVDTGYGLERIAWCCSGTKTIYETVFPEIIEWLIDNSKNSSDVASIYSLADHSKCLAFMLGDGIVPSNVKAGYLTRLIIRRGLRFIEKLGLNATLRELVIMQLEDLEKDFPSLKQQKKQAAEILDIETNRFSDTLSKGETLVKRIIKEKGNVDNESLIGLYDTHGIPPDVVKSIAKKEGVEIDIPKNFDSMIAELHSHEKEEEKPEEMQTNLPETRLLYYEDHYTKEFDAKVVWVKETNDGYEVILDKTAFYPEGGGQPADKGVLIANGRNINVKHVKKEGKSVIHLVDEKIDVGKKLHGVIDWDHRYTLMKHHTGTHVVNGALRKLFGEHIWQAGSQLGVNEARFDFSHYKPVSEEEIKQIEKLANDFVKKGAVVEKKVMERNDAERTYGFRLYQGGVPPGNMIRVLNIPGIDVEACGGTHLNNIKEIEKIRILKAERIQDGVNRIFFAAGKKADEYAEEENRLYEQIVNTLSPIYKIKERKDVSKQLQESAKIFSVSVQQLEKTIKRFLRETEFKNKKERTTVLNLVEACNNLFDKWKKTKKMIKQKSAEFHLLEELYKEEEIKIGGKQPAKIIFGDIPQSYDPIACAGKIVEQSGYIAYISSGNRVVLAASEDLDIDLRPIAREVGKVLGGSGGGKPHMAQCGGVKSGNTKEAINKAIELIETIK
ncbi:MAG: alanine--tRNA ligase [Thermoplasmatota archaeon]|jgi:alanyl-tRNA synthetase